MSAKRVYHDAVKHALVKDGWTITHDPFKLKWGGKNLYIDIGAEQLMAAEKDSQKIAIEVKSFIGSSDIYDLERALGHYVLYHDVLQEVEPDCKLYLALPRWVMLDIFEEPLGRLLLKNKRTMLVVFEPNQEVIVEWIS